MPDFRLRIWQEQTMYDCHDYIVTADTIEAAATKLRVAQEDAESGVLPLDMRAMPMCPEGIVGLDRHNKSVMLDLDPCEIVSGDLGVSEINKGGRKLRDIYPEDEGPRAGEAGLGENGSTP